MKMTKTITWVIADNKTQCNNLQPIKLLIIIKVSALNKMISPITITLRRKFNKLHQPWFRLHTSMFQQILEKVAMNKINWWISINFWFGLVKTLSLRSSSQMCFSNLSGHNLSLSLKCRRRKNRALLL